MNLKFFYVIDYNLQNPLLNKLEISKAFPGFKQATVNSKAFESDIECIQAAVDMVQKKHLEIAVSGNLPSDSLVFSEFYNPEFAPDGEEDGDLTEEDLELFEENSIAVFLLSEMETYDWLIKASVLIYDKASVGSLH